jgi:hypothetical protein
MRGRLRVGEAADGLPGVVRHGLDDASPALVIGGGEAGDEEGIAQGGQVVVCHQGRISNLDVGAGRYPVRPQERRDGGQEGVVHGFIRGLAIRRLAPEGDGPGDAPGRADERRQSRPRVLAIALGHRQGDRRRLRVELTRWWQLSPLDAA